MTVVDVARSIPNEPDMYEHPTTMGARGNGKRTDPRFRIPPHDLAAEEALLGAMLLSANAINTALEYELSAADFYKPAHGLIYSAAVALRARDEPADGVTVADELHRDSLLETIGGPSVLIALMTGTPAISNAAKYAKTVADFARMRGLISAAAEIAEIGYSLPDDVDQAHAAAIRLVEGAHPTATRTKERAVGGGQFILDTPAYVEAVWGDGSEILWAEGEPFMLNGPTGVGKTTVAQQVVLGRLGLRPKVLDRIVCPTSSRVLYIAGDRPRQAARSMRRMVREDQRRDLDDLLTFWPGPLPFDITADVRALTRFAQKHDADTIVIDSLKDVCHKLVDDEAASRTNAAIQEAIVAGIEVMVLHHQRKQAALSTKKEAPPKSIDDVYGSTWLTAGMGSVALIWGKAGDSIVELTHLKSPSEPVGPLTLEHNFDAGATTVNRVSDALEILRGAPRGITSVFLAKVMFGAEEPDKNQITRARRKLDALAKQGLAITREVPSPSGGKATSLFFATVPEEP